MRRHCFSFALAALVVANGLPAFAATITVQGILPLNRTSDDTPTYISTSGEPATFTKPIGLLVDALTAVDPRAVTGRNTRSPRDHTHSFTIDASEFAYGINLNAIATQFERRGDGGSNIDGPADTFDFIVYRIASNNANLSILPEPIGEILISATGLSLPTAASLGVDPTETNNGVSGTAIFEFSESLFLEPGAYAFQFLPNWTSTNGLETFDWVPGATYADGRRYERNGDGVLAGSSGDSAFGLIGTAAVAVPEPASVMLLGMAAVSLALLGRRK